MVITRCNELLRMQYLMNYKYKLSLHYSVKKSWTQSKLKQEKANDPSVKPSERLDAQFDADKAACKAAEHHAKAELHHAKHVAD
ncbi:unnamed protein product [Adineta ricciae]|uniref:Uncharacterized protein n=1 Tax=Adineta ricciae TaxID=249248 RepID=A0A814Z9F3_ADIRI|nr:unnamed protein product [Adineta ricciae]